MVGHNGLKIRMMVAGSILFGFYAAIAALVMAAFGTGTAVLGVLLVGSLLFVGVQYKLGKWMAIKSVGAKDMPEGRQGPYDFDRIHRSTEQLCDEMDIEKPRLMIAEMGVPNAFAVGRKKSGVVVLSSEIIQLLDHDELEGVIAHELAHIKNRDVVLMVIGQSIASMVGIIVQWAVMLSDDSIASIFLGIILGNIAQLIVMIFVLAISRYREYVADEDAATYTRNPEAMARALEKISAGAQNREMKDSAESVSALCIFGSSSGLVQKVFSTHPATEKRISRLRSM